MPHPRQLIREAAVAALLNRTAAGTRVVPTRTTVWRKHELPAISVYALEEEVDPASRKTAPRELTRTLQLAIECTVQVTAGLDLVLDDLSAEIERAMHADETLGGTAADSLLGSTHIGFDPEGSQPTGTMILTYAVTYYAFAVDAADGPQDDFKTADIRHSLGGAQAAADQAHDVVDLEA